MLIIMYTVRMNKLRTNFTLSVEALRLLSELAKKTGLSKSGLLELAIRLLAEKEEIE